MKVIVVGAGVVGVTTAFYLNKDGHDVSIVDRKEKAGMETSFANAGQLCHLTAKPWASPTVPLMIAREFGSPSAPYLIHPRGDIAMWKWLVRFLAQCRQSKYEITRSNLLRLAIHSTHLMGELVQSLNFDFDYDDKGILHLFHTPKSFNEAVSEQSKIPDPKHRGQILQNSDCINVEPALSHSGLQYAGGVLHPKEHTGDAHRFTVGLSNLVQKNGVNLEYGTSVKELMFDGEHVIGVATNKGSLKADLVIVSAANDTVGLLKPVYPSLPIYPVKGYSITVPTSGHNGAPSIGIQDQERKLGFSRLGDRLRVAGTAEIGSSDRSLNPGRIKALKSQAQAIFPGAGNYESAEPWAGFRPMTPDGAPIIGETKYKNLFLNTGHGSLGWSLACGSAHILAEIIAGRVSPIDLSGLTVARFN